MPDLLDQFGRPISACDLAALRGTVAGPTLAGVRSPFSGFPADGMTPWRLAGIHRAAAMGSSLAYMELAEDIEERDLHYAGVLATRKRQVIQLPMTVEAASEDPEHVQHADFLRDWLKAGVLDDALFDMADAIAKGYSVLEIEWDTAGPILPRKLHWRTQRWFEISWEDGDIIMLRSLDGSGTEAMGGLQPLAPWKFVVHRHPQKSGNVIRGGIARLASWAWMFKAFTLRDWAVFVQNYGQPIRVGRYGPDASKADRDVLWSAVASIAGDCAAIIPKSMEIEFQELGNLGAGAEVHQRRADWFDQQVSKAILGQTTTTDAISGGHAVAREHRLVQEDIERADARMLGTTITRQLFAPTIGFNFPGASAYPTCHIGRPDEVPIADVITALATLGPLGLAVKAKQMRERLGFEDPDKADEVIGGRPDPASAGADKPTLRPRSPKLPDGEQASPSPSMQSGAPAGAMQSLLARHSVSADPALVGALTDRVADDARGALAGLADGVRAEIEAAHSMSDLAGRLARLRLDPAELADAMGRGLALAQLVGQAALLDELGRPGRR